MTIRPQFDAVDTFSEGRAAVIIDKVNLWGFIDKTGHVVIKPSYVAVLPFFDGRALASQTGRCFSDALTLPLPSRNTDVGFIDINGKLVIPYQFENARSFAHGLAQIQIEERGLLTGYIDTNGNYVWEPQQ